MRTTDVAPRRERSADRRRRAAVALALGAVSLPASANGGVPMLFETFPAMVAALLPVIALETVLLARQLGCKARETVGAVGAGNLASTLVGIPAAWLLLAMIQSALGGGEYGVETPLQRVAAVVAQAPWLPFYRFDLHWMIPAATLVLLVPFFFVSWWIEYGVACRLLKGQERSRLVRAVRNANLASYALLAAVALAQLLRAEIGSY